MVLKMRLLAIALLTVTTLSAQPDSDQVLMQVGNLPVTVGEFTYIYEKNNGDNADYSKESVEEYLDLYTKFKLKVARAKDLQMDTITDLREELETYRRQLANSYLMDKEVMGKLVMQAHNRRQQDVLAAHLLIKPKKSNGTNAKQDVINQLNDIRNQITSGAMTWDDAVKTYSQDPNSAKTGGSLGYLTAMLPQGFMELEEALYELSVGDVSEVVKTKLGYHLVKVINRRPARGVVDAAHILVRKPKTGDATAAEAKAMQAYNDLLLGKSWDEVVKQYSEDLDTKNKKGAIGRVTIGKYSQAFEDAVFALEQNGAYTMPVETKAGYHIIQRLDAEDISDFEAYKRKTEPKMERRERYREARKQLIADIKAQNNYTINEPALKHFTSTLDEEFYTFKWTGDNVEDVEIFRFDDKVYKLTDFADYLKDNVKARQRYAKLKSASTAVDALLVKYSDEEAILYEESNLEASYPDFRNLMREYREGILLFEASKVNVWDKASNDTLGLKRFYENNKRRYTYPAKAKVVNYVVKSTDKKALKKILKVAKKSDAADVTKKFNKKDEFYIKTYEGELSRDSQQARTMDWEVGAVSTVEYSNEEGKSTFSKIVEVIPGRVKTLAEARGYVIADYQDHLENQWVAQLRSLYDVKLDNKVLKEIIK